MSGYTAIIDYGVGNLHSVAKALDFVGAKNIITGDVDEICRADALLLPGVGSFPMAYRALVDAGLRDIVCSEVKKKPLLGICLGMQLLLDRGFEDEECEGLGLVSGEVKRIETEFKLPQIGWNELEIKNPCDLTKGLPEHPYVYFVHSYCATVNKPEQLIATCDYGTEITAIVKNGNAYGCQFHPEKSGDVGLAILENFKNIIG
ncbi:MAG: imidazole glycerol phosphate synthase subunit HisH [Clostridia bacterium]|nr:imidazole glycerol phosphate synthase subunit HisH [Clostridia bacterium]